MKYLRLLVTLAVIGSLLGTVALASKAKGPVTSTSSSGGVASVQSTIAPTVDPKTAQLQSKVKLLMQREADPTSVTSLRKYSTKMAPVVAIPRPQLAPFAAPLSGTYQVGSGGDYTSLSDAVTALNANGVSGAVIMELKDATYNSVPVVIGTIAGSSSTNTITIRAKAAVAVTVNFMAYAGFGSGITIVDASYVTIDGVNSGGASLTLTYDAAAAFPSGDANSATVLISGTSHHVTVKNSTIFGMTNDNSDWNNVSDARQGIHVPGTGLSPHHVTISGNNIGRSYYGIVVASAQNVSITNNNLGAAAFGGGIENAIPIFVFSTDSLTLTGNNVLGNQYNDFFLNATGAFPPELGGLPEFDPLYTGPTYFVATENAFIFGIGVVLTGGGSVIANNVIDDYNAHMDPSNLAGEVDYTQYGLRDDGRSTSQRPLVYNNRVSRIYSDDDYFCGTFGHRIRFANVYHNSVYLSGASLAYLVNVARPDQACDVRNNAWFGDLTLGPFRSFGGLTVYNTTASGISDNNAIGHANPGVQSGTRRATTAGTLGQHIVATAKDSASVEGDSKFLSTTNLHVNTAVASAAHNIGKGGVLAIADVDADARSVSTPDAGADEFAGVDPPVDLMVGGIIAPPSSGVLTGTATSMKAMVKNSTNASKTYDLRMYVDSSGTIVYDQTVAGNIIAALGVQTVTMATQWTPLGTSGYKVVAKIQPAVAGDINAVNDTLARTQTIAFALTIPYTNAFDASGTTLPSGWSVPTGTWVRGVPAKATHITASYSGTKCMITGTSGTYTNSTLHSLNTPYFDLTGQTSVYIGWFQNLVTEPEWDRMVLQYSLDTGKTWSLVGGVNDANGINWYNTSTYANAGGQNGFDCYDSATARARNFIITPVPPGWTSDGDCLGDDIATGPFGWIFVQYHFTGVHPVLGQPLVGFRMAAFGDAGSADEGWAVDDFFINTTGNPATGTIDGKVYLDDNGNSTFDGGDAGISGRKVYLTGSKIDSATTNGSGDYSFPGLLAGAYTVTYTPTLPMGLTEPVGVVKSYSMLMAPGQNFPGDDFGEYNGGVTGKKFEDVNLNGVFDGTDHGLGDWVIEAHRDSIDGLLYASTTTDSGTGNYNLRLGVGTFYITEVAQAGWTEMFPPAGQYVEVISGTSGTTNATGDDFGNAQLGTIKIYLTADLNGDGTIIAGDNLIAFNAIMPVVLLKNNIPYDTITVGSGTSEGLFSDLGVGSYKIVHTAPSGFVQTAGGTPVFPIFSSGIKDTCRLYDFGLMSVTGHKFEDHNGDGVQDSADQGLAGWKIRVTGPKADSAITDATGLYTISGLPGGGDYALSEDLQSGWTKTKPTAASYTINSLSGQAAAAKDFGNFKLITISGKKYRDQNNSGSFDGVDVGLSGWTINATGVGSDVSDANGDWSFTGVGPGTDTVSEVSQLGYVLTEPVGGNYVVAASSGVDVTGLNFGNFNVGDSNQYRTWTVGELSNATEIKPKKRLKVGKPILYPPNSGNLLEDMLKFQAGVLRIGLTGQLNIGGKEKAYLQPAKQGDAFATFNKKGAVHTGLNRGIDVDIKGKLLLKRLKSLPATKKNDKLLAELLALRINVLASQLGKTPAGLGALEININGPYKGMTIDEFLAFMDTIMTNWEGQPYYLFDSASSIAAAVNGAFSTGSTGDTTALGGWTSVKLKWASPIYLVDRPILRHGATVKAKPPITESVKPLPTVYTLYQNYPNPFNPSTMISFDLPEDALVTLKLYNIVGQEVATLYNREEIGAGTEEVEFDASSLPSGVYIYRLVAEGLNEDGLTTGSNFTYVKKMMLVK